MKKITLLLTIMMIISLAGCDKPNAIESMFKNGSQKQQTVAENVPAVSPTAIVQDVQLAKIILKPERHKLSVTRDPFEPLIKPKNFDATANSVEQLQEMDALKGMEFLGLMKVGDIYSALIKTEKTKGVYKVNDQVNQLTITAIEEKSITFTKGSKTFKLKRGDK